MRGSATCEKLLSHAEAEATRQVAEAARQAAEEPAERLAAQLRDLGIDPNSVSECDTTPVWFREWFGTVEDHF